jgi:hypothetical protein
LKSARSAALFCATFAALAALPVHAQTTGPKDLTGPYIGAAWGPAFGNREIDDSNSRNDEGLGRSAKVYGGIQFTEHFGVQAGYVRLHALNQNTGSGASLVQQTVNGRSVYAAGTARLPLGSSFALTGKLGVSFGKVTAAHPATATNAALLGSRTSPLVGTGAEYVLNRQVAFAVDLDSYGKLSRQVKGSALNFGARVLF